MLNLKRFLKHKLFYTSYDLPPCMRKKILFCLERFPPSIGGAETLFYNTCKMFHPEDIIVLTRKFKGYKKFDQNQKFRIIRYKDFTYDEKKFFFQFMKIRKIIKKYKIEKIVIGNDKLCILALMIKFFLRKKYVIYAHGENMVKKEGRIYRFFSRLAMKNARLLISVSDSTAKLAKELNRNTVTIYNSVEKDRFFPKNKNKKLVNKYGLKNKKIILTLSRLQENKGHDKVILALPLLLKKHPNLAYLIAGTGECEVYLKSLVKRLDLEEKVIFTGAVPPKDLNDIYNLADVFIMPNRRRKTGYHEGFGIVFLEAAACGIPVIGGSKGGSVSAIKENYNGLLVNSIDEKDIYEKIDFLLSNNKKRKEMGKNGIEWAKNFTYEKSFSKLKKLLGMKN